MVRTQIQLTEGQVERLKEYAARKGVSMTEVIRQSVELFLASESKKEEKLYIKGKKAAGKYSSEILDLARKHDQYFLEDFKK